MMPSLAAMKIDTAGKSVGSPYDDYIDKYMKRIIREMAVEIVGCPHCVNPCSSGYTQSLSQRSNSYNPSTNYTIIAPNVELLLHASFKKTMTPFTVITIQINAGEKYDVFIQTQVLDNLKASSGYPYSEQLDSQNIDELCNAKVLQVQSASTSTEEEEDALDPVAPLASQTTLLQLLKDESGATAFLKRFDTSP